MNATHITAMTARDTGIRTAAAKIAATMTAAVRTARAGFIAHSKTAFFMSFLIERDCIAASTKVYLPQERPSTVRRIPTIQNRELQPR